MDELCYQVDQEGLLVRTVFGIIKNLSNMLHLINIQINPNIGIQNKSLVLREIKIY